MLGTGEVSRAQPTKSGLRIARICFIHRRIGIAWFTRKTPREASGGLAYRELLPTGAVPLAGVKR